jgi:hypothetical protein
MAKTLSVGLLASTAVVFASTAARSENLWSCEVALCMASPEGPTAAPAWRTPMERLAKRMRQRRLFPRRPQASTASIQPIVGVEGSPRVAAP